MESERLHRYIEDANAGNAALKFQVDEEDLESEQFQGRLEASLSRRRALQGQVIASDARMGALRRCSRGLSRQCASLEEGGAIFTLVDNRSREDTTYE